MAYREAVLLFEGLVFVTAALPFANPDKPDDVEPMSDVDGEMIAGVYVEVVKLPP